jgi:uncharacterized protein
MIRIFADSFYFFALLNPNDAAHQRALQFSKHHRGPLLTTAWVLVELADGLARTTHRSLFHQIERDLEANPGHLIITHDEMLFREGIDLNDARPDKEWSLTDCISFVVMQKEGVSDALTGDRHFEQAGFHALLK